VFLPEMPDNCLLLLDSYGGQNDDDMFNEVDEEVNSGKLLERLTIPPKTTPFIQPLDYGGFRNCKLFAKRISNFVIVEQIQINLKERNNIIKMWSLIFNQLNSEKFRNIFKNSWKCLEKDGQKLESENINNILFDLNSGICDNCSNTSFIICSYCDENLCFNHFFSNYHYHE